MTAFGPLNWEVNTQLVKRPMPVSDLMREKVVTASPDNSVSEIARQMRDENVGSVVLEEDGKPVGIITDRDIATRTVADGSNPESRTGRDAMTEDPRTIPDDAGVMDLCSEIGDACVRRMPVVRENGTLAGIITHDDLNTLLTYEQRELAKVIQKEMPEY